MRAVCAALVMALAATLPAGAQDHPPSAKTNFAGSVQYPILPRALEIDLALSAAPKSLRDGATVLALEASGYTTVRTGANAFTCLVSRRGGDLFPVCWDAEGTRALVPLDYEDARMRQAGKSSHEIAKAIADGFAGGKYHAPARAGISYMLSPLRYRIDEKGQVTKSPPLPHIMFYAPNLTDAEIGGARGGLVFINSVGPEGMMIVPVGQTERAAILGESQPLQEQLERVLGYQPPAR